jgi:TPP-dependent pyruvate/acetoin dehydrogenase alpha subunit
MRWSVACGRRETRGGNVMTSTGSAASPGNEVLVAWLHKLVEIRLAEDKVSEIYMQGLVPGTVYLCQGQEAVSVGACGALHDDDWLVCTYRGHHHALARGMDLESFFAEIMGRDNGICRGMGGSSHLVDRSLGMLGAPVIIGAGLAVATGAGMTAKLRGENRVAICFFGDGACNIGAFHEALNMAQLWKAHVVFVIENNQYGEYTAYRDSTALDGKLADRASAYGMANAVVDGQDAMAVFDVVAEARARAVAGDGPTLIEAETYRYRGHNRADPGAYRPDGELDAWRARDPINILRDHLQSIGAITADDLETAWDRLQHSVDDSAARAADGPWPTLEQARGYVFAD